MSIFDSIAVRSLPESVFNLSHEVKLSGNMGELIPIFLEEVLPGDTFQLKTQVFMRLAPMLAPIMHRVNVYVHYFYVPNRLVWDNWHDHITGGEDGLADPAHPYILIDDASKSLFTKGTLADYMGLPIVESETITEPVQVSALPFRGYQLIYNEYYRDQDLSPKIDIATGDGQEPDLNAACTMRFRAWEKDYFTSARPSSQKGPSTLLPIAGTFSPQYAENDGSGPDFNTGFDLDGNGNVTGPATTGAMSQNAGQLIYDKAGVNTNLSLHNLKDPQIIDNVQTDVESLHNQHKLGLAEKIYQFLNR